MFFHEGVLPRQTSNWWNIPLETQLVSGDNVTSTLTQTQRINGLIIIFASTISLVEVPVGSLMWRCKKKNIERSKQETVIYFPRWRNTCHVSATHPCVVSLGVQEGDGEGGGEVGRVKHVSEGQATFSQKPAHISTAVSTDTDLDTNKSTQKPSPFWCHQSFPSGNYLFKDLGLHI